MSAMELARDLHQGNPVQSLRQFLGRTSHLSPGYSPESFQAALKTGWQAVALQVQGTSPLPLSLVEEILALWDLQPKGLGPPEAARLLADLLRKNGLVEEAQTLLAGATDKNSSNRQDMLKSYSQKPSGLSGYRAGLVGAPNPIPFREEEQNFLSSAWQTHWQAGVEPAKNPGEDFLSWFLPRPANAAWLEGNIPALGKSQLHPWPPLLLDRSRHELARRCFTESSPLQAAQTPQLMAAQPRGRSRGPFPNTAWG
jgi:hypothetical protein